ARLLSTLEHPNVVKVHHFFENDPRYYYLVLESLQGGELFDHIGKKKTYTEREARDVCKGLVEAVRFLHSNDVVHRDVKPGSILLASPEKEYGSTTTTTTTTNTRCSLKLTDFGLACRVGDYPKSSTLGKSEFKPPEIMLGKPHGKPVDMWSIGCLGHILLCGRHPFLEKNANQTYLRIAAGDCHFSEKEGWGRITLHAKDFVQKLLTVNADNRMTAQLAADHPWLNATAQNLESHDLREKLSLLQTCNAKQKLRAMVWTWAAANRMLKVMKSEKSTGFSQTYKLGDPLGRGSFGTVFKATRIDNGNGSSAATAGAAAAEIPDCVAVKRIKKAGMTDHDKEAAVNEAKVMRGLKHENVLRIYDFYELEVDHYFIVLEYMKGGELFNRIEKKEFYNEEEARDVCLILLRAVEYIHSQDIVHRDLKPENLLLASPSEDSSLRVADFGLAGCVREEPLLGSCGTPAYVAPEVLKNIPHGTPADMWSVGVIFYLLLGGYHPFRDRNQPRMFRAIKTGQFQFHDRFWSQVSEQAKV
ncbi:unnamed protein product, partial [Pylaiella littoralis]